MKNNGEFKNYYKLIINFIGLAFIIGFLGKTRFEMVGFPAYVIKTINVSSVVYFIAVYVIGTILIHKLDDSKLKKLRLYPENFEEKDEREIAITARASKKSFMIMDFALSLGSAGIMFMAFVTHQYILKVIAVSLLLMYLLLNVTFAVAFRNETRKI